MWKAALFGCSWENGIDCAIVYTKFGIFVLGKSAWGSLGDKSSTPLSPRGTNRYKKSDSVLGSVTTKKPLAKSSVHRKAAGRPGLSRESVDQISNRNLFNTINSVVDNLQGKRGSDNRPVPNGKDIKSKRSTAEEPNSSNGSMLNNLTVLTSKYCSTSSSCSMVAGTVGRNGRICKTCST